MSKSRLSVTQRALTPREAAQILGVTPRHVQRLAQPGGPLVAERLHPFILITAESVEALKAKRDRATCKGAS